MLALRPERLQGTPLQNQAKTIFRNVVQMLNIYSEENPGDAVDRLREVYGTLRRETMQTLQTIEIATNLGYEKVKSDALAPIKDKKNKDMRTVSVVARNIHRLNALHTVSKPHVPTVPDIETLEEMIRYMHANVSGTHVMGTSIRKKCRNRDDEVIFHFDASKGKGIGRPFTIHDTTGAVRLVGGAIVSTNPTLASVLGYFRRYKSKIRGRVALTDELLKIRFPLAQHSSELQVIPEGKKQRVLYWGSGDPAYGTRRQEFSSKYLELFGFKTKECGSYGVRMEGVSGSVAQTDQWARAILYLLENSFGMDISGGPAFPDQFSMQIKNLIALQNHKDSVKTGSSNMAMVYDSDEFKVKSRLCKTERQKNILAHMLVSPFPSLPGYFTHEKEFPTHQYSFKNQNPTALGFAYYHMEDFFDRPISVPSLFEFLIDIDAVQSNCFEYSNYQDEIVRVTPYGTNDYGGLMTAIKTGVDLVWNGATHISVGNAKSLMACLTQRFYRDDMEAPWEKPDY